MVIKVSRVDVSKTATTTEHVPFETLTTESADLFKGEKTVTQAGVAGTTTKNFKLVLVDGREASRTLVSKTVSAPAGHREGHRRHQGKAQARGGEAAATPAPRPPP